MALACATPASASVETGGGFKFVTKSKFVGAGETRSIDAKCPNGTFALAGGVRANAGFEGAFTVDFPASKGSEEHPKFGGSWNAFAVNLTGDSFQLVVEAVCSDSKPKYRMDRFRVEANHQENVTPKCKGKEEAFDFAMLSAEVLLNSGYPEGKGWRAFIDNSQDQDVFVDTVITCLNLKYELESSRENVASGVHATNSAECPSGTVAVSGGQANNGTLEQILPTTGATVNQREFETGVDNRSGGQLSVNTIAMCVKKRR